jgi:hypothetical protein
LAATAMPKMKTNISTASAEERPIALTPPSKAVR